MSNTAKAVSREVPGKATAKKRALVVEADYFAMTSRKDPNVVFWEPGFARAGVPKIPKGITHLWIHRQTSEKYRRSLLSQAAARGIQVWKCQIHELRHRLLDFWTEENRSLMNPVMPEEDTAKGLEDSLVDLSRLSDSPSQSALSAVGKYESPIWGGEISLGDDEPVAEDRTGEDEDAIPQLPKGKKSAKDRRLQILRQAKQKFDRKKRQKMVEASEPSPVEPVVEQSAPEPLVFKKPSPLRLVQTPPAPRRVDPMEILGSALDCLAAFEREVFLSHYSKHSADATATAEEFGLPLGNVPKILVRGWNKLQQNGCSYSEDTLIAATGRKS